MGVGLLVDPARTGHAAGISELFDRCEHAVAGSVTSVDAYWNAEHTRIYTDIGIAVEEDLRGDFNAPNDVLVLTELGGTVGDVTMVVEHAPRFAVGERVLVFTEYTFDGRLIVLGRNGGKWRLADPPAERDPDTGEPRCASAGRVVYRPGADSLIAALRAESRALGYRPIGRRGTDDGHCPANPTEVDPFAPMAADPPFEGPKDWTDGVRTDWIEDELAGWMNDYGKIDVTDDAPAESWVHRTGMYSCFHANRWSPRGVYYPHAPEDEVFQFRTRHSKTFDNHDGTYTAVFLSDLHYQADAGRWCDVDLSLVPNDSGDFAQFGLCNLTNHFETYIDDGCGRQGMVFAWDGYAIQMMQTPRLEIVNADGTLAEVRERNLATAGQLSEARVVTYADSYPEISEELVMLKRGVEHGAFIHSAKWLGGSAGGELVFVERVSLPEGWQIVADGVSRCDDFVAQDFTLVRPDRQDGVHYCPVTVFDGAYSRDEIFKHAEIPQTEIARAKEAATPGNDGVFKSEYRVRFVDGGLEIAYAVAIDWLLADERSFPVYVDPTVEILTGYAQSSQTNSGMPYNTYYHDQRYDFLVLASDLTAAGISGGSSITGMSMYCSASGAMDLSNFRLRTAPTTATSITAWRTSGWTVNYGPVTHGTPASGTWYDYTFSTNYSFDGSTNIEWNVSRDNAGWSGLGGNYCRGTITDRAGYGYSDSGYTWPYDSMGRTSFNYLPSMKITYAAPTEHCYTCPTYDYSISPTSSYQTHSDSFLVNGCRWYRVYLSQYTTYRFTVCEGGGSYVDDTVFELYDSSCSQVAYNDDYCGLGSQVDYTPTTTAYYYLKVRGYGNDAETYTLAYRYVPGDCTACPSYDYGSYTPTTTYATHSGTVYRGGCRQYAFSLTGGHTYRFTFCEGGGTANYDTYLILRDSGCSQVASNDDSCGLLSQLDYTPSSSATFYLEVNSCCTGGSGGTYTLAYVDLTALPNITGVSPDHAPAGVGSAGPSGSLVAISGTDFGATQGANDHMVFWESGSNYLYNDSYIVSWSDSLIQCYVPAGCSSKDCAVYRDGTWSNFYPFTVDWSFWYRWEDQSAMPVEYYINENGTPDVAGDGEFDVIRASFQTWENVTSSYLDHSFRGTTTLTATNNDGINVISWTESGWPHGSGSIGVSTVWLTGGYITETDMELNGEEFTFTTGGVVAGQVDVQNLVTHEGGHGFCGLSDLYGVPDQDKTMYGQLDVTNGEDKKRSLEASDITGCQWIYPQTAAPAHDACASAIDITSVPAYVSGKNGLATSDYTGSTCDGPYNNLWWKVTGTGNQMIATTCSLNTTFDTEIAVYDGCGGSQLGCNDDNCGLSGHGLNSTVSWCSVYGQTYYIAVGSYYSGGSTGSFELQVYEGEITPGDPTNAAAVPLEICAGDSTTLSASVSGAQIDWYTGSCGGTPISTGNSIVVSPTSTTTYYARARNAVSGCYSPGCDSVTVIVNPLPAAPTNGQVDPVWTCPAGNADISATVGGGETIDWYTGSCGGTFAGTGNPLSVSPGATTAYYGVARNTSTNCESSSCISVTVEVDNEAPWFSFTAAERHAKRRRRRL